MFYCTKCNPELMGADGYSRDGYSPGYCEEHAPEQPARPYITAQERLRRRLMGEGS